MLFVYEYVSVSIQPQSTYLKPEEIATFEVEASGTIIYYQSYKDDILLVDDNRTSGSNTHQLSITGVELADEGMYKCQILSECNDIFSDEVALSVNKRTLNFTEAGITIQPNPANEVLYINTGDHKVTEIRVIDVSGRLLQIHSDGESINISYFAEGLYFIKVILNDKRYYYIFLVKN